jgi:predicted metal-binding protein
MRKVQKDGSGIPDGLNKYVTAALERDVDDALIIETSKVFTAPWVRMKCQFGCAGYGGHLSCPPHAPTPEQTRAVLDSYAFALLLHRHWQKGYKAVEDFNDVIVGLETAIFLDGFYKAFAMGSGPCTRCGECNISGTCLHPDRARPSMEACGIDVLRQPGARTFPSRS